MSWAPPPWVKAYASLTAMTAGDHLKRNSRIFKTVSGIPLEPCYANPDRPEDYLESLGDPGQFPYTRGIRPNQYRDRSWTMRQYAGFGSAAASNARFRYLLDSGQTGLSVAFDLPTQIGLDSDHPLAEGEVGRVGVAVDTLEDMRELFQGIPLDKVSTSMTINSTAAILLAMYVVVAEEQGVKPSDLRGTVQNDILKEYVARGTEIYPPASGLRLVTDVIEYCQQHLPQWNSVSVSGYHIREAGSNASQELAFTIANACVYVESALARGLAIDGFAPQLSFFFSVHNEFVEEIAKFRAARRMWSHIIRDRFRGRNERSMQLRFHAQTAGSTLSADFPDGNIVRAALQTLAAVLGGAQSIHTNSKDEALALPRDETARLALRTQQILASEMGLRAVDDPVGGAFALEALTDALEEAANEQIARIENCGGMLRAIESGYVRAEIEEAAYTYQRAVESGERVVVGVNRFRSEPDAGGMPTHVADTAQETGQIARLAAVKSSRSDTAVQEAVSQLKRVAGGTENVVPSILEAVRCDATVGEISDALRSVFGEYRRVV